MGVKKSYEKRKVEFSCAKCGKKFMNHMKNARYCSYECGKKATYYELPAIEKKAATMGANLLMGKGKRKALVGLIQDALDTPCIYCKKILTMETISIDHIEAYGSSKDRYDKKSAEGRILRAHMDRVENLRMICRSCNGSKGDFNHDEYQALLSMDDNFPGIVKKLKRRLQQAKMGWWAARNMR